MARRLLATLALLLATALALGTSPAARAQTSWVSLAGGAPGLSNDGQARSLTWLWSPGGASISGTVDITRTGAGQHYVLAESQLATIQAYAPSSGEYDNSPYAVSLGGAAGILQFGSEGESGRGPNDVPAGQFSTTVVDFRFDGTVSAPRNTLLTLFDPGSIELGVAGPAVYRFTAFYRGAPVDTSSWTVSVVKPYLPAVAPANWSWDAPSGTYRLSQYPSASAQPDYSDYSFPDTLVFINTQNTTFDRVVLTAEGLAFDTMAMSIGSANRPNLPITLNAAWSNATAADAVGLTIAGAGAELTSAGSAVAPTSSTAASANGVPGQLATIRETFTRGDAANYTITWSCRRLSNNVVFASGTGATGGFIMPTDSGVACGFTNLGRAALQLRKALPFGRRVASDQFSLAVAGPGAPVVVTTSGTGTTATGSVALATATVGSSYTFTETAAAGANLADYGSSWSCSNTRSGGQTPNGTGTSFALTLVAGDDLDCSFRNSVRPAADLRVRKSVAPAGARTGEVLSYTLVADNQGPDPANGALLRDAPGAGLDCSRPASTAACTASGGAACPSPTVPVASLLGSGILLPTLPVGGSVSLSLQCTVTATP
ncbi:hypothetical protein [Variovorax sp. HJSM1_2]|uniref:hypothetical protein n=1 Tax=Variovorax sp. HJSM1_2 TaxID=3366263 RepID=UPI003BD762F5